MPGPQAERSSDSRAEEAGAPRQTTAMDEADRAENAAITRFRRLERLLDDVREAASRADAARRLEWALARVPVSAQHRVVRLHRGTRR